MTFPLTVLSFVRYVNKWQRKILIFERAFISRNNGPQMQYYFITLGLKPIQKHARVLTLTSMQFSGVRCFAMNLLQVFWRQPLSADRKQQRGCPARCLGWLWGWRCRRSGAASRRPSPWGHWSWPGAGAWTCTVNSQLSSQLLRISLITLVWVSL